MDSEGRIRDAHLKKGDAELALVFFTVPPGTQASKVLEGRLARISKIVPNYQPIGTGTAEFASYKAPSAVFSQTRAGQTIVNKNILLIDGTAGYLFAWIVPQEQFEALDAPLRAILGSFEIVKDDRR